MIGPFFIIIYISLLPEIALPMVVWSAYSISPPTGSPLASFVTLIPAGFKILLM